MKTKHKEPHLPKKVRIFLALNMVCCLLFIVIALTIIYYYVSYSGFYSPMNGLIVIDTTMMSTEEVMATSIHETGHVVYHKIVTGLERKEWNKLFEESQPEEFVSRYAKTNAHEDFAETFEASVGCYYDGNKMSTVSHEKEVFMKKIVARALG